MRLPGDAGADAATRATRQYDKAAPRWHQLVSFWAAAAIGRWQEAGGRRQVAAGKRPSGKTVESVTKSHRMSN